MRAAIAPCTAWREHQRAMTDLTLSEAAEATGLHKNTVLCFIKSGKISETRNPQMRTGPSSTPDSTEQVLKSICGGS
jgi:hypothetical protein